MDDVHAIVTGLIEQVTDVPAEEMTADTRFDALDNWTSFAALRLLTLVEERFGIGLDFRAYFAAARVGDLASLVVAAWPQAEAESA
jgi:acyl carrier protein